MPRANTKSWKRKPLDERKAIKEHEDRLRSLPCVVTGIEDPECMTLHHCHGGSMKDWGVHVGFGQKSSDWLQIPLLRKYHTGDLGIDSGIGVKTWEERYGRQIVHLRNIFEQIGYNGFERSRFYNNARGGTKAEMYLL